MLFSRGLRLLGRQELIVVLPDAVMGLLPSSVIFDSFSVLFDYYFRLRLTGSINPFCEKQMSARFWGVLLLLSAWISRRRRFLGLGVVKGTESVRCDGTFETLNSFTAITFPPE